VPDASLRRLAARWIALGGGTGVVAAVGRRGLPPPPVLDPAALAGWAARLGPLDATFAVLRSTTVVLGAYLLAVSTVGVVAGRRRMPALRRASAFLTPPPLRVLLAVAAGASTAAITATPAVAAGTPPSEPPTLRPVSPTPHAAPPTLVPVPGAPGVTPPTLRPVSPTPHAAPPTLVSVPGAPGVTPPALSPVPRPDHPSPPRHRGRRRPPDPVRIPQPQARRRPAPTTWTVAPGDSFWSIARDTLAGALGRPPTDTETARYWMALIAANRGRLPVAGEPGLLFTGDRLLLPPVTP
jgi:nucleoid-associated protein YgaU